MLTNLDSVLFIFPCSSLLLARLLLSSPLVVQVWQAKMFVNPELNTGFGTDSGFGSAIVEGHVGYEFDNGISVQAGPALLIPDQGESELEISGKGQHRFWSALW